MRLLPALGLAALAQFALWVGQTNVTRSNVAIAMNPQVFVVKFTDIRGRKQFHLLCNQPELALVGAVYHRDTDSLEVRRLELMEVGE